MGHIYSLLGYGSDSDNKNLEAIFAENFSCNICWRTLREPVQCQNNEHYFCRNCITEYLRNSKTCPLCADQLTIESLRPASRVVSNVVSKMTTAQTNKKPPSIFIFGGGYNDVAKSVEILDWSTKKWTILANCLFFKRRNSFSFLYGKKVMVCGGYSTGRIEYLDPSQSGYASTVASVSLPEYDSRFNGVLYENRILTFYKDVIETSFVSGKSRTLLKGQDSREIAGVHRIGSDIYIVGRRGNTMEKYDVAKNELQMLPSLPYSVYNMTTVAYRRDIIIIGGCTSNSGGEPLNDVIMFNVATREYKRLPSMLSRRRGCAAVVMGNMIVVMGGATKNVKSEWTTLRTVEYFVIGESAWLELPAMNLAREGSSACVYE